MRGVALEQMTKFLAAIEAPGEHVVLSQRLEIRSLSPNEDRLNVAIELATWERTEVEEDVEEEEP